MKAWRMLLAAAVLFLAASAMAATTITLDKPAELNGTQLAPGDYIVKFDADHVTFFKGKIEVASAKAKLEERANKSPYDALLVTHQGTTNVIREVSFKGKKQVAVISADTASNAGN